MSLLSIENLEVLFAMGAHKQGPFLKGIEGVDLTIERGEMVAILGASGSGKSLLAHAIMGLLPDNAVVKGAITYEGQPLTEAAQERLRGYKIAFIPQSVTYLDPLMKVGPQVRGFTHPVTMEEVDACFNRLSLKLEAKSMYPFELSGGMARRTLVSTALLGDADLIIADEPTPGMAVKDAVEALSMLRDLVNQGKSCLLITHDIDLAVEVADRVGVFYEGTLMDVVDAKACKTPETLTNPYTRALFQSLPQFGFTVFSPEEVTQFCEEAMQIRNEAKQATEGGEDAC